MISNHDFKSFDFKSDRTLFKCNQIVRVTRNIFYFVKKLSLLTLSLNLFSVALGPLDAGSGFVGPVKIDPRSWLIRPPILLFLTMKMHIVFF